jgi:hypothetical protein
LVEGEELLANPNSSILEFKVGNGSKIFMWLDVWHPDGCLLDKYAPIPIYEAGSSLDAKLSTIICNGEWNWPHARSDRIVDLQSKLPEVEVGTQDQPVWNCKKGEYVCSGTWEAIQMKEFPVKCGGNWFGILWLYLVTPSFCGWFLGMH